MKKAKKVLALFLAIIMVNTMTMSVSATPIFTVAVNGLKLRETAGLNGRLIAYLGLGNHMDCYYTTGVIDNQLWRYGKMIDNDVAGLVGFASAAYLR